MIKDANQSGSPFELVLVDWKMPNMDGIETIQRIINNSNLTVKPRIILMTAYGKSDLLKVSKNTGVDTILIKPLNQSTLIDSIHGVFGFEEQKEMRQTQVDLNLIKKLDTIRSAKIQIIRNFLSLQ